MFFAVMLCVGTLVMSSSILAFAIDDENASAEATDKACMASVWLCSMGFIIAFLALFTVSKVRNIRTFKSLTTEH